MATPLRKNIPLTDHSDYILLCLTAALVVFGSVMVFSSSVIMADTRWHNPYIFIVKHSIWVTVGVAMMLLLWNSDYHKLQKHARLLMGVGLVLLVLVLIIGTVKGGAKRWFQWGFISFQPSELGKLLLVIGLADYLDRKKSKLAQWKGLMPALVITAMFCGLIALEPDLGTPIIMVCVSLSMLYAAGARMKHIGILIGSILPLVVEEILRKPYRLRRVKDFLASWGDISSASYQLNQSLLALGSGGFLGKGLAQSQMKLMYLPEPHTDFIFPIVGEELGFVGTTFLISLFLAFAWRGWTISRESSDYFGSILALGITWLVMFQTLLNMAVASGLLPTKGLPLPFVSYGGTTLVFNLAAVGILLNISKRKVAR